MFLFLSHPAWGAWIEIRWKHVFYQIFSGRTPHGVRGLKYDAFNAGHISSMSHPAWGAWIEISENVDIQKQTKVAPRMGCVD